MRLALPVLFVSLLVLPGCQLFSGSENQEPVYASGADENLRKGQECLANKRYIEAAKYFEYVRTKYPFLEASKEAELLLADTDFAHDQYVEARDRYDAFVKLHPSHPKVDYAAFRAALTHYKEIPSDFFVLPPPHEKEQTEEKGALAAMGEFVRLHANSPYIGEARTVLLDVRKRLARHEQYAADFYAKREKWVAVVGRLETLVTKYPGTGMDADAYLQLHDVYDRMGDQPKATDALERLVAKCPGTWQAERGQKLLQHP